MRYFLVVYDRRARQVVREDTFTNGRGALAARFDAERQRPPGSDIEVVVLVAESHDALTRTHGRYFKSVAQLIEDALAAT